MRGDLSLLVIGYLVGMVVLVGIIYYAMGPGKTAASANATATPTATAAPTSTISPTNVFSLPTATPSVQQTPEPKEFCADGTEKGKCSADFKLCKKESGVLLLVQDCTACGCREQGQKCNNATRECFFGCSDGTLLLQCSNATPNYYCNENASLEINGFECGCPLGYQYDPYGSGPNSFNGCTSTCRTGPECLPGK